MVVHERSGVAAGGICLLAFLTCAAAGLVAATGRATVALTLVGVAILAGATILERSRVAPLLWAGAAFTAPLQGVRVSTVLALSDVLLVAAFVTILPDAFRGWRRVVPPGVVIAFGLLLTAGLVGTFFAPSASASLVNLVKIVLAAAGSVVFMALWDPGADSLRRFAWLWFAGATSSATLAAIRPREFVGRALGLTTHPNHFGLVCLLAVGLGLGLVLSSTGRVRMATCACVLILIAGAGLSGSRAAILGLAVTIGTTALLTRKFRVLAATGVGVIVAAMAVVAGIVHVPASHALSRLGGGGGSAASDAERNALLSEAFASIARHPFTGEGFEFAQVAHSIYVQALVVGGPLALIGFLCVCGLILRTGARAATAQRGRRDGPVLAGLTAGYAGYLVSGAFDNILWDRYLWVYIGLLLALAASASRPLYPRHQTGRVDQEAGRAVVDRGTILADPDMDVFPRADGRSAQVYRPLDQSAPSR